ncbi:hypothetical protein A3B45_05185 [Candidatus Daviesbacteria bacterium RIFCSPLOWO2_01_FULL_39_12]|uniref:Uncharacterized protein n=1 Tax=Candidatus Daviesbacteria bacterium RIFCSPLOWO2_01_FULL_39_12 TaxID=1797785 RepID=A0A1F5KUL3_9BACT|nr:MAG: hypothetical protein A3B45_05185 [Candidatus Daviesbacteria bacterium RIFCSPLOWO2_01_FULL_39_12]
MGAENIEGKDSWKNPKQKDERRFISHAGKGKTADMSISPDVVIGRVDPRATRKSIRRLSRMGHRAPH